MTTPAGAASTPSAPARHLLIVGSAVLLASIAAFFRVPILPTLGAELRMDAAQLGLITTAFAVGRIVTDVPAGRLTDRVRTLTLLSSASVVLAAGSLLFATAATPTAVLGAAFVLGIASSITNTTGMTFFSTARPAASRGRSLALYSASLLVGQALGPTAGGLLAGPFGWRGALYGAAAVGLALLVATRIAAATVRPAIGSLRAVGTAPVSGAPVAAAQAVDPSVTREVRILLLVPFTLFFVLGSLPQTLLPIIGAERHGLDVATIGLALGLGGLCRLIGVLIGGRVSDHIGRKAALVPGMLLMLGGVALLALDGVGAWVGAIVLLSLGTSGLGSAATMLTDLTGGHGIGRRMGTFRLFGDLGLIVGPFTATRVYVIAGQRATVAVLGALLLALTLIAGLLVRETRDRTV